MKPNETTFKTHENSLTSFTPLKTHQKKSSKTIKNPYLTGVPLIQQVCGPRYSVLEYGPAYAVDSTMVPEAWAVENEVHDL